MATGQQEFGSSSSVESRLAGNRRGSQGCKFSIGARFKAAPNWFLQGNTPMKPSHGSFKTRGLVMGLLQPRIVSLMFGRSAGHLILGESQVTERGASLIGCFLGFLLNRRHFDLKQLRNSARNLSWAVASWALGCFPR